MLFNFKIIKALKRRLPGQNFRLWYLLGFIMIALILSGCSKQKAAPAEQAFREKLFEKITTSNIPWSKIGKSVQQRDILALQMGSGDSTTIIFGGFHGDEVRGIELVHRFAEYLHREQPSLTARVIIIPLLNPDGLLAGTRVNANKVDINRNFQTANWRSDSGSGRTYPGPKPASEPETRIVIELLRQYQPQRIISVHTPLEVVNYDGPGKNLAERMALHTGYPAEGDIGYPTPGSFGTYAGKEMQIPTITHELPRGDYDWDANRKALMEAVTY